LRKERTKVANITTPVSWALAVKLIRKYERMPVDEIEKVLRKSKFSVYLSILMGVALLALSMRVWWHFENLKADNRDTLELILKIEKFDLPQQEKSYIGVVNDILLEFLEKRMSVLFTFRWVLVLFAFIFFYHAFEHQKLRKIINKNRGT
jgi:hypothetical protein